MMPSQISSSSGLSTRPAPLPPSVAPSSFAPPSVAPSSSAPSSSAAGDGGPPPKSLGEDVARAFVRAGATAATYAPGVLLELTPIGHIILNAKMLRQAGHPLKGNLTGARLLASYPSHVSARLAAICGTKFTYALSEDLLIGALGPEHRATAKTGATAIAAVAATLAVTWGENVQLRLNSAWKEVHAAPVPAKPRTGVLFKGVREVGVAAALGPLQEMVEGRLPIENHTTRGMVAGLLSGASVALATQWADNAAVHQVHAGTSPVKTLGELAARDGMLGLLFGNVGFRLARLPLLLSLCAGSHELLKDHLLGPDTPRAAK